MPFLGTENRRQHHVGLEKYKIVHHDFNHFTLGPSKGKSDKRSNKMAFTLLEPENLQPSFNVLYVRTQRPAVLRLPLVQAFLDTWAEAVELVRPVFRFGIPESSLRDKCKYWRDDGSSLPTNPSFQTQRLMKALSNEAFGASRLGHRAHTHSPHQGQQQQQPPLLHGVQDQQQQQRQQQQQQLQPGEEAAARGGPAGAATQDKSVGHGHGHDSGGHGGHGHGGHGKGGHGGGGHGKRHLTPFQEKEEFVEAVTPWAVLGLNIAAWCYLGASASKPGM
ncbi:hypothetical protein PLESTB_000023700 [Pleodorina starrii]|uniref:Uncharacterized protein n=1 Tax=Pleodorina starrii TaxID=330485 RepID=A0A9W6B897_9CHLO|nr:hypothetical protein PLESTM_001111100 [Pleodorina starrii]GLC47769.1 hypothetical protein PLESTB_000023700 [Pleodorina starrii]GLC70818.1 hypothetical protein PLESTF_001036300 [Pleodorina starrii]